MLVYVLFVFEVPSSFIFELIEQLETALCFTYYQSNTIH